jgi:hypothetical protein
LSYKPEVDDTHIWQFSASGQYSTKSAYEALFTGAVHFKPRERIWKSWALGKCKFFIGRRHTKNVGQLIALQEKDFLTLQFALFVTKLKKL